MDKVLTIDNVLPKSVNKGIITYLTNRCSWGIAKESGATPYDMLIKLKKYAGFSIETINNPEHEFLNTCATIIAEKVKESFNIKKNPMRYMWNMYYINHRSLAHVDDERLDSFSIIYNLNDSDGGTQIGNAFYQDIEGQAKVFKSNILHSGIGPKTTSCRFNLNIVLNK